jgi:hypothetical protein
MIQNPPAGGGAAPAYLSKVITPDAPDFGWALQDASGDAVATFGGQNLVATGHAPTAYRSAGPWAGEFAIGGFNTIKYLESAAALTALNKQLEWSMEGLFYLPDFKSLSGVLFGYGNAARGECLGVGYTSGAVANANGVWLTPLRPGINWLMGVNNVGASMPGAHALHEMAAGWHHCAAVRLGNFDGGNDTVFYLDGFPFRVSTTAMVAPDSTCRFAVGADPVAHTTDMTAGIRICHVYAYAKKLSRTRILARVDALNALQVT